MLFSYPGKCTSEYYLKATLAMANFFHGCDKGKLLFENCLYGLHFHAACMLSYMYSKLLTFEFVQLINGLPSKDALKAFTITLGILVTQSITIYNFYYCLFACL
jgi:hypothetical protein